MWQKSPQILALIALPCPIATSLNMLAPARFRSPQLEAQYREERARELTAQDLQAAAAFCLLWLTDCYKSVRVPRPDREHSLWVCAWLGSFCSAAGHQPQPSLVCAGSWAASGRSPEGHRLAHCRGPEANLCHEDCGARFLRAVQVSQF